MPVLHILTYISLILFVVACVMRAKRIASAPLHLRWELYPVPHEKGRAHYGGSIMEEVDHWEKKHEKDHLGEILYMIPEIILLKGVWVHNKSLWTGSFPFHFALYLLIANMFVVSFAAIMQLTGSTVAPDAGGLMTIAYYKFTAIVWIASILGIFGSIRLFFLRIVDKRLANFSTPSHFFNIILIGAIYLTTLIWILVDPNFFQNCVAFYASMFSFNFAVELPAIAYWNIGTVILFMAYLPFTHMTHFFTKYFTYHSVRWNDTPNKSGSKMSEQIGELLNQPITWAAPHIGADGQKTWVAVATTNPFKKEEKKDE
jgi:nitrate reductase gamma subunit